jgi:transcriptional regulator with XRE-family HTH domain
MIIKGVMVTLINEADVLRAIAGGLRAQRIQLGWRQADLAVRSGVPLRTLRKFETTGLIGTGAFAQLLVSLGLADKFLEFLKPAPPAPRSLDEFLTSGAPLRTRQRVRRVLPRK